MQPSIENHDNALLSSVLKEKLEGKTMEGLATEQQKQWMLCLGKVLNYGSEYTVMQPRTYSVHNKTTRETTHRSYQS